MNSCGTEICKFPISVLTNHVFTATKHAREKKLPIRYLLDEQAIPNTFCHTHSKKSSRISTMTFATRLSSENDAVFADAEACVAPN